MRQKTAVLALLCLKLTFIQILTACSPDLGKDTSPDDAISALDKDVKILSLGDFKSEIIPLDEPNKYLLQIQWPKTKGTVLISQNKEPRAELEGEAAFYEMHVNGGDQFRLETQYQGPDKTFSQTHDIQVPKDFVLLNTLVLSEDFKFSGGRVFLLNRARIQTLTFNLNIDATDFISEDAVIETFPKGTTARLEQHGRSGGSLNIRSLEARGRLYVDLIGENGGNGKPGIDIPLSSPLHCNGTHGGNGGSGGELTLLINSDSSIEVIINLVPGSGGAGGLSGVSHLTPPDISIHPPCLNQSLPGNPGVNGKARACVKTKKNSPPVCQES